MYNYRTKFLPLLLLVLLIVIGAYGAYKVSAHERNKPTEISVDIINSSGQKSGTAKLLQTSDGVRIQIAVSGLTPGLHGFHFHENGACEPPKFESAGAHFNPQMKQHGFINPRGPHDGDLPNLQADQAGNAKLDVVTKLVSLQQGQANSLLKEGGTSLIIHAAKDDYKTDPSGNSGDRMFCGVVK